MDANQQTSIESKLRWAWRQERRFLHLRGAFRLLIWLLVLLAIGFIIDWGLFAKAGLRANLGIVLLVVNVAILGWVLWREWLRHLKPFDPVHVSLAVEKRHSGLHSLLVSYAQLKDPAGAEKATVSAELIGAMRDQAVLQARPLDFREIVDFGQLKNLLLVGAGVILLFAVLSIRWSDHVGVFFQRLAGASVRYPTQTQVKSVSGDLTVRVGDTAILNAKAGGVLPPDGRLFTRPAGSNAAWKELPMKADEDPASYSREVKGLTGDLRYYVRVGDDRSEEHVIRIITAPQVVATKVTLEYPGYMNKAASASDQLNLEVPEGTKVLWNLTCTPPVKRCEVIVGERTFDAKLDASGTQFDFELTAKEAFKYTFRWTEREKEFKYDDVQYAVRVVPDGLPEVELLRPATNGLATVKKNLKISARASDDHGLAQAWLLYSINAGKEERVQIHDFKGAPGQEFTHEWKLNKALADLKPPAQVAIAIEVADLHPDKATHKRRSSTRVLTIVEPEAYLDWYRAELAAQTEELKRSRDSETAASSQVKAIKAQESDQKPK